MACSAGVLLGDVVFLGHRQGLGLRRFRAALRQCRRQFLYFSAGLGKLLLQFRMLLVEGELLAVPRAIQLVPFPLVLLAGCRFVEDIEDPAACMAAIVEMHVWAHASDPPVMMIADTELRALSGERLKKVVKFRDDYEGVWRSVIRTGVKQRIFEVSQEELASRALLQMTTGVAHWFSPSGKLRLEQLCHEYADWSLALLRARHGKRQYIQGAMPVSACLGGA